MAMSSASSSKGQFDPSAYAALRKEQIARAKELREARSAMMGDNNPRIAFGPSSASQATPCLTRSLSSSDISRRRHSDAPRHQSPQPKQRTPHYALPLNPASSCSYRNSLGGTSGPLNSAGATPSGGFVPFGSIKSQKGAFATEPFRSGGHSEPAAGGAGSKRKPRVRKENNGVKSISALNDASKFSDEELAAFSAAGAAAESLLAEENGISRPPPPQAHMEGQDASELSEAAEEVVKEVTPTTQEKLQDVSAAGTAEGSGAAELLAAQGKVTGSDAEQSRSESTSCSSGSKGSKGLFSRSFRASMRLLRRALPSNGGSGTGGEENTGAGTGKKSSAERRGELDDVNGTENGLEKMHGGSDGVAKGSQGAWMEVLRAPNSSSNSNSGAGLKKDKENLQRLTAS